jgi:Zn-dependent protease
MAGIVSNFILAALATLAAAVVVKTASIVGSVGPVTGVLLQMADYGIVINLILAFFNLVPIPPLDGSHVVAHMLPRSLAIRYQEAGRYGLPILMGLFFLVPGFFQYILWPVTYLRGMADLFIRLWI